MNELDSNIVYQWRVNANNIFFCSLTEYTSHVTINVKPEIVRILGTWLKKENIFLWLSLLLVYPVIVPLYFYMHCLSGCMICCLVSLFPHIAAPIHSCIYQVRKIIFSWLYLSTFPLSIFLVISYLPFTIHSLPHFPSIYNAFIHVTSCVCFDPFVSACHEEKTSLHTPLCFSLSLYYPPFFSLFFPLSIFSIYSSFTAEWACNLFLRSRFIICSQSKVTCCFKMAFYVFSM